MAIFIKRKKSRRMSKYYVIEIRYTVNDEIEVRYMCKDGYFVIHNIENAHKYSEDCEWLIDHIVDRWNSEYQHGIKAIYAMVLIKGNNNKRKSE